MASLPDAPRPPISTASLFSEVLDARARDSTFDPREIRLSEAGGCGRRQTLRALGYQSTPHNARQLAIFETGHVTEDRVRQLWQRRYPRQIKQQIEVKSPFGVGHIDIWVSPLKHIVECKTTTEKQLPRLPLHSHVAQVNLYLHYWGNARGATAEITYVIKETGEIRSYPVVYDPALVRQLVVGLMDVESAISVTRTPLPIPDDYQATQFPCAWYTPRGLERCGFWDHCWGTQVSNINEAKSVVAVAPPLLADIEEYATLRQQQQALDAQGHLIKSRRTELEAGFATLLEDRQADALRAGSTTIKRTVVSGRTTTDLEAAIEAGSVDKNALVPFQTTHPSWNKWTVRIPKPPTQRGAKK